MLPILESHLTSFVFLFLTVLPMFLGYLPPLTSYKFFVLILFSVLALSVQLPQLFGTPFLTLSVHLLHLTLFGGILKRTLSKHLLVSLAANSSASDLFMSLKVPFTPDELRCVALQHRVACCVVFAAYRKTPHRNAHDIHTRNRYQILVPENWYQNLAPVLVPVARFLVPETYMADYADEIAVVVYHRKTCTL